jgi:ribosomal RNA-processing protein 17
MLHWLTLAQLREERKHDLERHVKEVNALLRQAGLESEDASSDQGDEGKENQEWEGLEDPPDVDHEAEYIDEDRYTTVTVEAMDPSRTGLYNAEKEAQDGATGSEAKPEDTADSNGKRQGKRTWTKERPVKEGQAPKKKRKKFRYENKAERKLSRVKEKLKNSRQAKARRAG